MMRFFIVAVLMLGLVGTLSACGRKGDPDAPPGTTYPRTYPDQ